MKLSDLFLEILSQCSDDLTRDIAQSMKVALKTPAIAEVFDVCIVNGMGYKGHISIDTLSQAERGFNDYNDLMLEKSNLTELQKQLEKAGITYLVTKLDSVTRTESKVPINEMASSHMARCTFIGNIYKLVKDPNLISVLTGHAEGSRAFNRYRDIDIDMKRDLVKILEGKR